MVASTSSIPLYIGDRKQHEKYFGKQPLKVSVKQSLKRTVRLVPSISPVIISALAIVWIPLSLYSDEKHQNKNLNEYAKEVIMGWNGLIHNSIWPVIVITSIVAFFFAYKRDKKGMCTCYDKKKSYPKSSYKMHTLILALSIAILSVVQSQLQIICPSWMWNPFLWGWYKVYFPSDIAPALKGVCVDYTYQNRNEVESPLCLSEKSWKVLSAEALSSHNPEDVQTVLKGIHFARHISGGIVISILARDIVDAIAPLRQNVEGLLPFFSHLSVVVFENDSTDGTREAFYQWRSQANGYIVDVMDCPEASECRFHTSHRNDSIEAPNYFKSSAIGAMASYRQRVSDYILSNPNYQNYSHVMVLDPDLSVSFSPLGLLHTLGKLPDSPVASSGRQVWPGSWGTFVPPYDFSAFRVHPTSRLQRLLALHERFCGLQPLGDRWRNQCDAASSMHLIMILSSDDYSYHKNEPYRVQSAFNGATLYPIQTIKDTHATYDTGPDGQRCEHIGFNIKLNTPFYINPKWDFHINPTTPGGPTGRHAAKNLVRIAFTPQIGLPIFFQMLVCLLILIYSVMTLVLCCIYPFWKKICQALHCKSFMFHSLDFASSAFYWRGRRKGMTSTTTTLKGGLAMDYKFVPSNHHHHCHTFSNLPLDFIVPPDDFEKTV